MGIGFCLESQETEKSHNMMASWSKSLSLILVLLPFSVMANFDHGEWDELLKQNVIVLAGATATQVNYDGMMADRSKLRGYLTSVAEVDRQVFENWEHPIQLAFLINAYNAWTVELVLTEYPDIDSIKDIGFLFSSPWRKDIVSLFGQQVSLDDIEHEMIRGWNRYQEPRIHFAVNCAAIGCPSLRAEAFRGEILGQQLEENTRLFLSDNSRNYFSNGRLYISSIFDWYEEDFEKAWKGINSVSEFLLPYAEVLGLDDGSKSLLRDENIPIRYLRYDWDLNRSP